MMIFDEQGPTAAKIVACLGENGSSASKYEKAQDFREALRQERPALALIVVGAGDPAGPEHDARELGIRTLAVVAPGVDPKAMGERLGGFDDWLAAEAIEGELLVRVGRLIRGNPGSAPPAIDPHFLALVVHDLRTPLNVIGLTIRAIGQSTPHPTAEFEEDLTFLQENARQIDRMLAQLADYCRLLEGESSAHRTPAFEFDPRRFLADFIEDRQSRPGVEITPVRLEVADQSPVEVELDQGRARLALQHAVANAVAAAGDGPVRVRSTGTADRWIIEVIVDRPPPPTVQATDLRPGVFERLTGVAAERRGLDLAIAARVTELFGGSARLDVDPGRRTTIVLDWPTRPASPR